MKQMQDVQTQLNRNSETWNSHVDKLPEELNAANEYF